MAGSEGAGRVKEAELLLRWASTGLGWDVASWPSLMLCTERTGVAGVLGYAVVTYSRNGGQK